MDYDFAIKIIIIGDSNVGKSCILTKFIDNEFNSKNNTTIGVDYKSYRTNYLNQDIKIIIWDTAGQERFKAITKSFYKGVNAVIICFDLTDSNSFDNVDLWLEEINKEKLINPIFVLVGTKSDLTNLRTITKEEALKKTTQLNFHAYFETSSKTNTGIKNIFTNIIKLFFLFNDLYIISKNTKNTKNINIKLHNQTKISKCFAWLF